jgi:hypothetical protein
VRECVSVNTSDNVSWREYENVLVEVWDCVVWLDTINAHLLCKRAES